jgi:uncharacterized protein HemX
METVVDGKNRTGPISVVGGWPSIAAGLLEMGNRLIDMQEKRASEPAADEAQPPAAAGSGSPPGMGLYVLVALVVALTVCGGGIGIAMTWHDSTANRALTERMDRYERQQTETDQRLDRLAADIRERQVQTDQRLDALDDNSKAIRWSVEGIAAQVGARPPEQ